MDLSSIQKQATLDALGLYKLAGWADTIGRGFWRAGVSMQRSPNAWTKGILTAGGAAGTGLRTGILGAGAGALYGGLTAAPGEGWSGAWQGAKRGGAVGAAGGALYGGVQGYRGARDLVNSPSAARARDALREAGRSMRDAGRSIQGWGPKPLPPAVVA